MYSSSPHLYTDLDIPAGTKAHRRLRHRRGLPGRFALLRARRGCRPPTRKARAARAVATGARAVRTGVGSTFAEGVEARGPGRPPRDTPAEDRATRRRRHATAGRAPSDARRPPSPPPVASCVAVATGAALSRRAPEQPFRVERAARAAVAFDAPAGATGPARRGELRVRRATRGTATAPVRPDSRPPRVDGACRCPA